MTDIKRGFDAGVEASIGALYMDDYLADMDPTAADRLAVLLRDMRDKWHAANGHLSKVEPA